MTVINASMLGAQNVGSVISFREGGEDITTTLEGFARSERAISVFTPIQDDPFELSAGHSIEISLQHGALYTRQVLQTLEQFIEHRDAIYNVSNVHSGKN